MDAGDIQVNVIDDIDYECLAKDWQALQLCADHRFFLSWYWIKSWLHSFPINPVLLKATLNNKVVGLALFCKNNEKKLRFFKTDCLILQESGEPDYDQQWIEYNQFLLDKEHRQICFNAIIDELVRLHGWDEFHIGVVESSTVAQMQDALKLPYLIKWQTRAHWIDLNEIRDKHDNFIASLSRNARSQIRRSIKLYEKQSPIKIHHADNLDNALALFDELAPLHIKRWGSGYQQSGFANPLFVNFHKNLISDCFDKGRIDIIKISTQEAPIAYFYNFIYQNRVYFYLSALTYSSDNKLKPGLVGHALCIQHYLDKGLELYDLMGGGEDYKDRLSTYHDDYYRVAFQRPRIITKVESLLKRIKNAL